jgi:alkylation response protein AidB-like acyl-CoA dehydrogenase
MATFTQEDRTALTDALQRLLGDLGTESDVRRSMDTDEGYDPTLWRRLGEMGVIGLVVEERFGGGGGGPVELELVMEQVGAALLCGPLLSSGVLAATLVNALNDDEAKARLLPEIANGQRIATVALTGDGGGWTKEGVDVTAQAAAGDWVLSGRSSFVTHGQIADTLLVVACTGNDLAIFEVNAGADGMTVSPLPAFDRTLRLSRLTFEATPARPLAQARPAWDAVERALDIARVALAGEQAGGARRLLEMTVDYAKARVQFGRSIGSFQAIKHMAADLLLESESAISAARHAAEALADGAPEAAIAVSLAAFACADAFNTVAAASIQMHGGIAFTWAHPAHLYLRRARADAQLFGPPAFYRERFLRLLGA